MRRQRSILTHLIGLVLAVLMPLLVFNAFLVIRSAEHEQEITAESARFRTQIAAASIEGAVSTLRAQLFVLAGRLSLQTSDLNEFHDLAKEEFDPMTVILSSAEGREIINTAKPFGEPLPDNPDTATLKYVAETQRSRVGDMTIDPITGRPMVTINVPVSRDSRLVYILSLDITSTLPRILKQLDLPEGWVATIVDRRGYLIGRSRDPERFVGELARPEFIQNISAADEGWVSGVSREGVPLYTAFAHTRLGGWTISAGIPRDIHLAPVRQSTATLIVAGGIIVILAVAQAVFIGRRIAAPLKDLVATAELVGKGEPATLRLGRLTEANEVARSVSDASERLIRIAAEREAAIAALAESEQMYRALAIDLARVDEERSALVGRMVVAQENERKRIARELHDDLAQHLTALQLKLDAPSKARTEDTFPRGVPVEELRNSIGELGRAMDRMAWELRPVKLDEVGLHTAVDHYLEEWADLARLQVDSEIDLGDLVLPPAVETTLFRILQEATTNVTRHAVATRVAVVLEANSDRVRLIVEDDGKGFLVNDGRPPFAASRQYGLLGMRERLALVRGELDVETAPDRGTTLFVTIPLRQGPTPP